MQSDQPTFERCHLCIATRQETEPHGNFRFANLVEDLEIEVKGRPGSHWRLGWVQYKSVQCRFCGFSFACWIHRCESFGPNYITAWVSSFENIEDCSVSWLYTISSALIRGNCKMDDLLRLSCLTDFIQPLWHCDCCDSDHSARVFGREALYSTIYTAKKTRAYCKIILQDWTCQNCHLWELCSWGSTVSEDAWNVQAWETLRSRATCPCASFQIDYKQLLTHLQNCVDCKKYICSLSGQIWRSETTFHHCYDPFDDNYL